MRQPLRVYLASPANQLQAHIVREMPVLMSFAVAKHHTGRWLDHALPSFSRLLIDSGAYSELSGRVTIDLDEYLEWAARITWADAFAGLDDISGDWKRSLSNYERGGFPTFHDSDPDELLPDLIDLARARGGWIGLGLIPPRQGKERWLRETLDRIPDELHVHGWALRLYAHLSRLDSIDSTNWLRDAMKLSAHPLLTHLTLGETLEIIAARYRRIGRAPDSETHNRQTSLDLEVY